jgi:hypothetical protein
MERPINLKEDGFKGKLNVIKEIKVRFEKEVNHQKEIA